MIRLVYSSMSGKAGDKKYNVFVETYLDGTLYSVNRTGEHVDHKGMMRFFRGIVREAGPQEKQLHFRIERQGKDPVEGKFTDRDAEIICNGTDEVFEKWLEPTVVHAKLSDLVEKPGASVMAWRGGKFQLSDALPLDKELK